MSDDELLLGLHRNVRRIRAERAFDHMRGQMAMTHGSTMDELLTEMGVSAKAVQDVQISRIRAEQRAALKEMNA